MGIQVRQAGRYKSNIMGKDWPGYDGDDVDLPINVADFNLKDLFVLFRHGGQEFGIDIVGEKLPLVGCERCKL